MQIYFKQSKFEKQTRTLESAKREWGELRGKLLRRRLDELAAAETLEVMRHIPGAKCHELTGNWKGHLAVNVDQPYRLLFVPNHDPVPAKPDGGLDWTKVTAIKIIEVSNYHD